MQKPNYNETDLSTPETQRLHRLKHTFEDDRALEYITRSARSLIPRLEKLNDEDPNWSEPCKRFLRWCDAELQNSNLTGEARVRLFFKGRIPSLVSAIQSVNESDFRRYILYLIINDGYSFSTESLIDRIHAWSTWITPISGSYLLDGRSAHGQDLSRLFTGRPSWMRALSLLAGSTKAMASALEDAAASRSFRVAMDSSLLGDGSYLLNRYALFSQRDSTPIGYETATSTGNENARELKEFLKISGFDALAKTLISEVTFPQTSKTTTDGLFDHGTISILLKERSHPYDRRRVPEILFHEIGHAAQKRLSAHVDGQELFDAYTANLVYNGRYKSSAYCAAMLEIYGPESMHFINEAFAEDFRLYVIQPDSVPYKRMEQLEAILHILFPTSDFEYLRSKVQIAYRTVYGGGPINIHLPPTCESVRFWREETEVNGYYNEHI